ncbi:GFA family protein [Shimia sp.]|uniref:GFA family protein n=1 Tax=Shimia sp. TaxID=1954381 RepID=UPI00329848EB
MTGTAKTYSGACGCGQLTYEMHGAPMIVHCCHCLECQKQTGSAYVLNAIVETDRVQLKGNRTEHTLSTPSGKGQIVTRCADCGTAVVSRYMVRLGKLTYVRVGTLDDPASCPPDVQIFTSSKQPWVPLSSDIPVFDEGYKFEDVWPADALARMTAAYES